MVASRERASLVERIGSLRLKYLKVQAMLSIERDPIDSLRWHMALSQEEFHQVRRDRDNTRRRLRRLGSYVERHLEALVAHEATRAANALKAENQSQNGSDGGNGDGENGNSENGNGGNGNPNENGQGHYRSDCPKLKDQNRGNKAGNKNRVGEERGKTYVLGKGDANPDSNVVKDVISAVELADGRISETNTVLRGCTLGLLGHPFNIDLMPVKLGSFDAIIGMDWLANHNAVIVCDEKVVRIPYGDEVLIVQGDGGSRKEKSKLSIISCTKTHKYERLPNFSGTRTDIQEKNKKKAKNKQNRARSGKDQVKSKSKVIHMKKIQLEGLKLPNLKLYCKRKRQGSKLQRRQRLHSSYTTLGDQSCLLP
ncbi:putative reverse transcriptase domain-containing protein [Tanacetum coccineum]